VDNTDKQDLTCLAFPQRWGLMLSKEEELQVSQELGYRRI
jgi:hypothetical protein